MITRMDEAKHDIDANTHRTICEATILGVGNGIEDVILPVFIDKMNDGFLMAVVLGVQ